MTNVKKLSKQQEKIVESKEHRVVVMASAGAGKTHILTERVRWILRNGGDPNKMVIITFTNNSAAELRTRLGEDYKEGMFIGTVHGYANWLLGSHGIDTSTLRNAEHFDGLFELVMAHPEVVRPIGFLALDESQDSSNQQFEFIFDMLQPKAFFVVGDVRQCQPEGTKVLMADKTEKNIEDLEIGDNVISYDSSAGRICGGSTHNAKKNLIEDIAVRTLADEEEIIDVYTEDGKKTSYTANHKTFAMLNRYDEYNYLTYLMCDKNNRFRVGTSQFKNSNNYPWKGKVLSEGGTKLWILDVFKTNKEARVLEDKVSYLYQIPQMTFQLDKTTYTQQDLDYIYDGLNTLASAEKCLASFGRNIDYPFYEKNNSVHYAGNAFSIVHACNLLPHNMQVMSFDQEKKHKKESVNISKIVKRINTGEKVYSLKVSPNEAYVADGIVTHNSIYGFNGANPKRVLSLSRMDGVVTYDLTQNYRNSREVISYSNNILNQMKDIPRVPVIGMNPDAGKVIKTSDTAYMKLIQKDPEKYGDWVILCRTNNTIYNVMGKLRTMGIPCTTFRQAQGSKDELNEKIKENSVKVLTIHSSKGLEFEKVVVAEQRWRSEEDLRVMYVAATRAIQELYVVGK